MTINVGHKLNLALVVTGASFETGLEEKFYFSNSGVTTNVAGSTENYFNPLIKGSVLLQQEVGNRSDSISIRLINKDLEILTDYLFHGYRLELYAVSNYATSTNKWYPLFIGTTDSLLVQKLEVQIKAVSHFDVFSKIINPEVFSGVRGEYEGDTSLKGTPKPRLFGMVHNIKPIMLRSDNLVYGCNWAYDGQREAILGFDEIRDGGQPLTVDTSVSPTGNFATTSSMDLQQPQSGTYVTCLNEGTFKLGSQPVFDITADVAQITQTITDFVGLFVAELGLAGYDILSAPDYTFGVYHTSTVSYTALFDSILMNLDIAYWFDANELLTINSIRDYEDQEHLVRFIDAGQDFIDDTDIVVFDIERIGYNLPIKQIQLGYQKNYTVQDQSSLSTGITQEEKETYKLDYRYSTHLLKCNEALYKNLDSVEYETNIQNEHDADNEASNWLEVRKNITDKLEVTCPIMSSNSQVVLGVIIGESSNCVNIASTHTLISSTSVLISNNNPDCSIQNSLNLGDTVLVNSVYFNDSLDEKYVVYGIRIDTLKMSVTYKLSGIRKISQCYKNVIDGVDNVIDGIDNVVDDY